MKIEEEIHQSTGFKNEWIKAHVNLIFTESHIKAQIKKLADEYGITPQQYNVLRILRGQHPEFTTVSVIRDRLIDKMSDTSRIVDRLTEKKLVDKHPCKHDRRLVDIRINHNGLALLAKMEDFEQKVTEMYYNLTEEEAQQLNTLLDKIREKG
jgi:DNA-binding MarR family transcriptional regulator